MKGEAGEKEEDRFWREKDVHVEIPDVLINLLSHLSLSSQGEIELRVEGRGKK